MQLLHPYVQDYPMQLDMQFETTHLIVMLMEGTPLKPERMRRDQSLLP
jgi:hypothetical protein